jgi:hypothetical protein
LTAHAHGHSHGLVDPSIKRSRAGLAAVGWSLLVLAIAFMLRSARAERWAGLAVVFAIFASACVAGYEWVLRLIDPLIGLDVADPLIGLAITVVILRITWHSWQTVSAA